MAVSAARRNVATFCDREDLIATIRCAACLSEARKIQTLVVDSIHWPNRYLANLLVAMYGRLRSLQDARNVYENIQEPTGAICRTMMVIYAQNGCINDAKLLFDGAPSTRNIVQWSSLITMYALKGHLREAREAFDKMPARDLIVWTSMSSAYNQQGHIQEASDLFFDMPSHDLVSWNALVAAFAQNGYNSRAKEAFHKMPFWDFFSFNSVFMAFSAASFEDAKAMFDLNPARNVVTWNIMFQAYAQNGYTTRQESILREARDMYDRMPEWNSASFSCILQLYLDYGHINEARCLFEEIPTRDVQCYTSMVTAYGVLGDVELAKICFDKMPARDSVAWNSIVHTYAENGHLQLCKEAFDNMVERGTRCWNVLLTAYAQEGHLSNAKFMFDRMPSHSDYSWNSLIMAFAHAGRLEEAQQTLESMPVACPVSWNIMLVAYAQRGQLETAKGVFDEMPIRNVPAWNALLEALSKHGHAESTLELFRDMNLDGQNPDVITFMSILSACSHLGLTDDVSSYFRSISFDFGVEPEEGHYSCVVDLLGRSGQLRLAVELLETMPFEPNHIAWSSLLSGCNDDSELGGQISEKVSALDPGRSSPYVVLSRIYGSKKDK